MRTIIAFVLGVALGLALPGIAQRARVRGVGVTLDKGPVVIPAPAK